MASLRKGRGREARAQPRDHRQWLVHELPPGDADDPKTGGGKVSVAYAVPFESLARRVIGESVDLDHQTVCRPVEIHLVSHDRDVGQRDGKTRPFDQGEESHLGVRACPPGPVLTDDVS